MSAMSENPVQNAITQKLSALRPAHLEVLNESAMHSVPAGSESHFKVVVVAAQFQGVMPVARHRQVNALLAAELAGPVHALSLHAMTPAEWAAAGARSPASPACRGGSKLQQSS